MILELLYFHGGCLLTNRGYLFFNVEGRQELGAFQYFFQIVNFTGCSELSADFCWYSTEELVAQQLASCCTV
ncbi:MAG: hypothetical protein MPK62_05845 [Alphaproteobacteria bacterium]|nr:hypothetical protein [Alphaproteobacteria bacterium]MDA8009443.1 hypothetical protein [Alphaproteobacteria bacterium]MDA8030643.1 hypothetical protein [Alphaproteobacteria bacterium]